MSKIKALASQTAYYGLSSVLGRMLNYALVPLHTRVLTHQADYGMVGELYAYVSFLNIIFLCGMETAFFRFSSKQEERKQEVYHTAFTWVGLVSVLLSGFMILFSAQIVSWLSPEASSIQLYKQEYIVYFALIMGFDALSAIPFALLRQQNRPKKFAFIKLLNIGVNVLLNVYFLWLCPKIYAHHADSFWLLGFSPDKMVAYVFLSNLVASALTIAFLYQEIRQVRLLWNTNLLKPMLLYALPLLVAGLAGMTNETLDRILLKYLLPGEVSARLAQIGVYNAAYKLSIFMTLAIQAFRMAAEPFFFSLHKQQDSREVYAKVMNYFVLACVLIFAGVVLHLDILSFILGERYRQGLGVVPILLFANMFLGIYLNASIWFKLSDKTYWGIYLTLIGAVLTIVLNFWLIPILGFYGSAWATLVAYGVMMLACYWAGQRNYAIPYQLSTILLYVFVALCIWAFKIFINHVTDSLLLKQTIQTALFFIGAFWVYKILLQAKNTGN